MTHMTHSPKLEVAVAGAGYWGPNLIRNISQNPRAQLSAVCDPDSDARKRIESKYPGVVTFDSLDAVLEHAGAQALVIATPTRLHFDHALRGLEAGLHVFVEKPPAEKTQDMLKLARTADERNLVLLVGHTFLYNNIVRDVKGRIDSGDLGGIQYIYSQRLNLGRFRRESDVLWTLAPHDISIINYWLNDRPVEVTAQGLSNVWKDEDIPDVAFALMRYGSGTAAHLHLSWLDPQKTRRAVVVGDQKMLIYDDVDTTQHIQILDKGVHWEHRGSVDGYGEFGARIRAGGVEIPRVSLKEPLAVEFDHFVDCIETGGRPLTDGWHGLEVLAVLEALSESMSDGGTPVRVEYPMNPN